MNFHKLFIGVTVVVLAGCTNSANVDYDQAVNFSQINTYAWREQPQVNRSADTFYLSQLSHRRMVYAIDNQLIHNGLIKVEAAQADVVVSYHATVAKQVVMEPSPRIHYSLGVSNHAHWNHFGLNYQYSPTYRTYDQSSMVIDIFDQKQQLIWRGGLKSPLAVGQTPAQRAKEINRTVAKILANFPPKLSTSR